jgi:alpha-galactosidase
LLVSLPSGPAGAAKLSKPDGKPAKMTKAVQVFIMLGQSNMVGLGKITGPEGSLENAVKEKKKYSYLVDDAGNWAERPDVRFVRVMSGRGGGMQQFNNEFLTVKACKTIGPEFGIGQCH